jgi:xanthine permease XanP
VGHVRLSYRLSSRSGRPAARVSQLDGSIPQSLALLKRLWLILQKEPIGRKLARPPELLFAVDEKPPRTILVVSAVQHLAINAVTLVFPLILAREAGLGGDRLINFVSISMLALGMATIFLCARSQFIGSEYLCPAGFSQIYLGPSLISLRYGGIELASSMTVVAGLMQIGLAPLLRRLRPLLPAEITGLVIAIVGLSLALYGFKFIFGIPENAGFNTANLATATLTLVTMTVLNIWTKGYTKIFCALIGIVAGYIASVALGILDLSAVIPKQGLAILRLPEFGSMGWDFNINLLAPFAIATVATTLRTMGDISNAQRINDKDWVRPDFGSLAGGVAANGLATTVFGIFGP